MDKHNLSKDTYTDFAYMHAHTHPFKFLCGQISLQILFNLQSILTGENRMFFTNVGVAPTTNRFCFPIPLDRAEREHLFLLGCDGADIC